jgi:DNA-binding IclR family transcriptional regulator
MDKTHPLPDPGEDRYLVPGLIRGLQALNAFTPERREMTLSEIARHLGLSRSAAFRTVYTLAHLGYLLHDTRAQTYALGPAVLRLGHGYMASRELVQIALPELERLRDETDWSTHLGVRDGRTVLYTLRVPSRMGLSSIVHVGSRLPAAATVMGRVLLADLSEAELATLYREAGHEAVPGRAARSMPDLLAQWRQDRGRATVVQVGSFETGIAAVAAPVRDLSGRAIAAINATTSARDGDPVDGGIRQAVQDCAARISAMLGA